MIGDPRAHRAAADAAGDYAVKVTVDGAESVAKTVRVTDRTVRLSSMTLTHEMARLLLVEQVYRGLTILRGMPYHRA